MSTIISTEPRMQNPNMESLQRGYKQLPHALNMMGFDALRPGQEPVIVNIMAQRDTICILPTSCHALGQGIMMYDRSIRKVEEILKGEFVMGWDNTPREVTNVVFGNYSSSRITPWLPCMKSFVVTDEHLLTLINVHTDVVIDMSVNDYIKLHSTVKDTLELFTVTVDGYPNIANRCRFTVDSVDNQDFCGITITGDGRYLMDDFTVTHNTGKSACFAIPTICLNWRTLVFSPLVALMRDQVRSMSAKGIKAQAVSSMQTDAENAAAIRRWAEGDLQMLYVAPERLHNDMFKEAMRRMPPDMVTLDEGHTLSQWSDNFRSSYCLVGDFIREHNPKVVTVFTATCPDEVEVDIRRVLNLGNAHKLTFFPRRTNLLLRSEPLHSDTRLAEFVYDTKGSSIVYCATINKVEQVTRYLADTLREDVLMFHGELSPTDKRTNQDLFMSGKVRVMVATNAFGMGVDHGSIRSVVHRDFPGSIENLSQELGRAGRDGKESICMTFNSPDSLQTQKFFIECGHPTRSEITSVHRVLQRAADSNGVSQLTLMDICKKTNLFSRKVPSILEILKSNKVIEREKAGDKIAKIRKDVNLPQDDDRFDKWWDVIQDYGLEEDGFYNIDINWMADHLGLGYQTIVNHLKKWDATKVIRFVPPFRGSATRITGALDQIDFTRLAVKAAGAHTKLDQVLQYMNTPDEEKHTYLEKYFGVYK